MTSASIHVVCALAGEAATLASQTGTCRGGVAVSVCGIGPSRAGQAAQRALDGYSPTCRPRALVSWGLAGALAPHLRSGALLLPARVEDERGHAWTLPGAGRQGVLLSVASLAGGRQGKARLRHSSRCDAVDMESAAIAAVCEREGVPFVAVRAIADPAHRALPDWLTELVNEHGRASAAALLRRLARAPRFTPAIIRCLVDYRTGLHALRQAAGRLPQLVEGLP